MKRPLPTKHLLALFIILVMGMGTIWASDTKDDYTNSYFTIESLVDNNNIEMSIPPGVTSEELTSVSYSTDGTNWTTIEIDDTDQSFTVVLNQNEKLYFKGLGRQYATYDAPSYCHFLASEDFMVYGNIMSLLYGDDFASQTELPEGTDNTFSALFQSNDHLVSVENLVLPATVLTPYGYSFMFNGCKKLTSTPTLPATTMSDHCYFKMFMNCYLLTTVSELPATAMARSCYSYMFKNCRSLVTPPELPATTLATSCYNEMFSTCPSLTVAPAIPATTAADYCCYGMYYQCGSLSTAHELRPMTMALSCYAYMFADCTSLTEAPDLPATTLADSCYQTMFAGCLSLNSAPSQLPATTLATSCYELMFFGCPNLTEAPELPATTLTDYCYAAMFDFCSSLRKAPVLPAPVLTLHCYLDMFEGCTSLHEIVCLATDISAPNCTSGWVRDIASSGTLYKAPEMENWIPNSESGIPVGWTVANYDGMTEQQDEVVAYPNPVKDKFHLNGRDIQSVKVFDVQGRLVHSEECGHANQVELDLQGYSKGMYSVSIQSEGRNAIQKIIKN